MGLKIRPDIEAMLCGAIRSGVTPLFTNSMFDVPKEYNRAQRKFVLGVLAFCELCGDPNIEVNHFCFNQSKILTRHPELKLTWSVTRASIT